MGPLLSPYLEILTTPRAWRFSLSAWFARLLRSTAGIGAILLVASRSDNYALAGSVSGAVVVGAAASGTVWSRMADSRGQAAVLPAAMAASTLSAVAFVCAVEFGAPPWTWFVSAFLVGASSIDAGSLARARWVHLLPAADQRHTALALESVGDEFAFVIGPPLVTVLAGAVSPVFGFAVGVGVTVVGLAVLLAQRSTAPRPSPVATERGRWLPRGVLGLLPAYVGVGLMFGAVDLTAVGVAREAGEPAVAGLLLAVFAIGSVTSGIVFGALSARWRPLPRLVVASLAFAVVTLLFLAVREVPWLALTSFAVGLATSPVMISGSSFIETIVDRATITTAMTWPTVALAIGVTAGASLAGASIDRGGAFAGLLVPACAGVIVGVSGLVDGIVRARKAG